LPVDMSPSSNPPKRRRTKTGEPKALKSTTTGLSLVDALSINERPSIHDYIGAVSQYVLQAASLNDARSKQAQIALSSGLGRALAEELVAKVPRIKPYPGELTVAGALRTARADVSEPHYLDGLRLAVEIKPINLAVGRAMWNRFGDIRAFAVNIHLKFPFAVVGGVLVVPIWSWEKKTKRMLAEEEAEAALAAQLKTAGYPTVASDIAVEGPESDADGEDADGEDVDEEDEVEALAEAGTAVYKKSTIELINRLIQRLTNTRLRDTEADPGHLLEAVAVIVYDPDKAELHPTLPPDGSKLRWDKFIDILAERYDIRFED
jgi:hypothetical protein